MARKKISWIWWLLGGGAVGYLIFRSSRSNAALPAATPAPAPAPAPAASSGGGPGTDYLGPAPNTLWDDTDPYDVGGGA